MPIELLMTPEQWQRVKALFGAALEQAPGERAALLEQVCGPEDIAVRREVEALLAAHEESDSFLETPAVALVPGAAAEPSLLQQGETIGRYRLLGLLGAGGMGQVYLAEDPRLRRQIALKLLPRSLSQDAERLRRFEQEARTASALSHPNVCVIYEVADTDDGRPFLAMEYVQGTTLREQLERHREAGTRMPLDQVLDAASQVAAGLAAAHDAGIVHRDLKPENVMLRPDGLVKVLDFGLAKLTQGSGATPAFQSRQSHHTEAGMVLGTVQYMSPEQARGLPVDWRTDVWSLGAMLYELLTCQPAFTGATTTDIMVAILDREPAPLATLCPGVPPAVQEIVMRALRKDREERTATMRELREALNAARQQLSSSGSNPPALVAAPSVEYGIATEPSLAERAGGVVESRPVPAAPRQRWRGLAGAAAVLAVAAGGVWWAMRPQVPALQANQVAVTTFDNASGDALLAPVGRLLADYFAGAAGTVDGVSVVDRDVILRAEAEGQGRSATTEAVRVGLARRTRAALLVSGTFYVVGDSLQVQVRLVDAASGEVIRALRPVRAPRADPTHSLDPLRDRVLGGLAILSDPTFGASMLPIGDPPAYAAYLDVREGLEIEAALRQPDAGEAERASALLRFSRAAEADTSYLQARLWFASAALRRFGGESLADSALVFVQQRADRLSAFERAMLDALRADEGGNHEVSSRGWRRAAAIAGSWPPRWWLANKLRDANRPREALAVFDSLGALNPHFLRALPPILHYIGDYQGELAALAAEGERTPSIVHTLDYQQAALQALAGLDSVNVVLERIDAVVSLPSEGGTSVAYLLLRTAWELGAHGHPDAAAQLRDRALRWCAGRTARDLRNPLLRFDCLEVAAAAGEWTEVRRGVEEELRASPGDLPLLGLLGLAAAQRGDRRMADSVSAVIEARARADGSRGLPEWLRARIAAALGEREAAVALLRDAFARGATWGFRLDMHRDPAFQSLRGYPPFEQLMQPQG